MTITMTMAMAMAKTIIAHIPFSFTCHHATMELGGGGTQTLRPRPKREPQ